MNSEQAKKIAFPDLLARLGFHPVKIEKNGRELWYKSPFREEKEASFHTTFIRDKWVWKDFGDTGGTVIDFAIRYQNLSTVREALDWLGLMTQGHLFESPRLERVGEESKGSDLFSFHQQGQNFSQNSATGRDLEFLDAHPIANPAIHNYLEKERLIPANLADMYLVEVKYRNQVTGKDYFAFGMKNEGGGYEVRVASDKYAFKSALIVRDVTLIKGTSPERGIINVFEGMIDFLSLLVMLNCKRLAGDALVMHSLSSFHRTVELIRAGSYQSVNTFLDNDTPGKKATEDFKTEFPGLVTCQSEMYANYKDLNEALKKNKVA